MARNKSRRERRSAVSAAAAAPPAGSDLATPRRSYRHTVNSAIDATPRSVNNAFATAESGNVRAMMALFKDSRVLDDRLDRVCSDRAEALVGKPLVFKPPPQHAESGRAREIATNVSRLWNATESTGDLIGHLMHAVLEHAAAAEQKWIADGETGWWRAQPLFAEQGFVRSTELAWNKSLQLCLADPSGYALAPLDDYPDRFIRFVPTNGRADYPWRRGAMRSRITASILARFATKAWVAMLERWGQPAVIAKEDDATKAEEIRSALAAIGVEWRAVFPTSTTVEPIEVAVDAVLHKTFIDHVFSSHAIAILGQEGSTGPAASYAAAVAALRVRYDLLAADAAALAEALWKWWILPVCQYNDWEIAPYCEFVLTPKRELTIQDFQGGLYSADETRISQGHDAEANGKGSRYFSPGAAVNVGNAPNPDSDAKPSDTGQPGPATADDEPGLVPQKKPEEGDAPEGADAEDVANVSASSALADTALNGAQMAALETIVTKVETGERSKETAVEQITAEFATIDKAKAQAIVATITPRKIESEGGTPPPPPSDTAPP